MPTRFAPASISRIKEQMTIFDEGYEVVAVENQRLVIRGVVSGNVLFIDTDPELSRKGFRPGQLITLSDPGAGIPN